MCEPLEEEVERQRQEELAMDIWEPEADYIPDKKDLEHERVFMRPCDVR